jgi:hypothetical protein
MKAIRPALTTLSLLTAVTLAAQGAGPKGKGKDAPAPSSSAPAPPSSASAAPEAPLPLGQALQGEAKQAYESGRLLYSDGDFSGALLKFQQALELSGDPRLLWNMAVCEKNLRRYARVLHLVERYQKEGGALLTESDRSEAADLAIAVRSFVGTVHVQCAEPGAAVALDGEPVGSTPLQAPVTATMGARTVRFTKAGFVEHATTVQVPGGASVTVACKLDREVRDGRLVVLADPNQTIWIDAKAVGTGRWEGPLSSGGHNVRVTAPGKRAWQTDITLRDAERRELRVVLENEASGPSWMWFAGGAAVLAGAVVGGYFLLRPKDEPGPPPLVGTMQPGTVQVPLLTGR